MHIVRWIVGASVFLALLYLSLQNSDPAALRVFNVASLKAPLVVIVFITLASCLAIGLLVGALRAARLKRQISRLRSEQPGPHDPSTINAGAVAPRTSPASGPVF